jgi:hypothetical protein
MSQTRKPLVGPPCPVVMVRGIPPAIHLAVRAFARRQRITMGQAYSLLLAAGLAVAKSGGNTP